MEKEYTGTCGCKFLEFSDETGGSCIYIAEYKCLKHKRDWNYGVIDGETTKINDALHWNGQDWINLGGQVVNYNSSALEE